MQNLFWDSCIFNAFLYDEKDIYDVNSIQQYLSEAQAGAFKIYTSSMLLVETRQSKIARTEIGSALDLVNDLVGACVIVDASVEILSLAGRLRDIPYQKQNSRRALDAGDAIMLATAIHLQDTFEVAIHCFHTFDNGKKRGVPLLSFHEWCLDLEGDSKRLAEKVISLSRERPVHPSLKLAV